MLNSLLILLIFGKLNAPDSATQTTPMLGQNDLPDWRNQSKCGINALYVILKSEGIDINYDDLLLQANMTSNGISLYEIQRLGLLYKKKLTPVKISQNSISTLNFPFIIHTENQNFFKHYLILLSVESGKYKILDPTSGEFLIWESGDMNDKWTGYAIGEINYLPSLNFYALSIAFAMLGILLYNLRHNAKKLLLSVFFLQLEREMVKK